MNPKKFEHNSNKSDWNLHPSLFIDKGHEVISIGKYELYKFYFIYLKFKPDIIKIDWVPASMIPLTFKKLGLVKCPIVMDWSDFFEEMLMNYPKFIARFMERFSVRNADYLTTASRRNEQEAIKMGKEVLYIPHGVFTNDKKIDDYNVPELINARGKIDLYI